jgi:predicted nuclease with TOPRIM domain
MHNHDYSDLLARCQALEEELEEANKEIAALKSDLEGSDGYAADARKKIKQLQAENSELRECSKSHETLIQQYETKLSKAESRIHELEADRNSKAPLIKVAVDIRCRYLEQAQAVDTEATWGKCNQDIVEAGNRAAHSAMGHVDMLLFRHDYLDMGRKLKLARIFTNLYKSNPENYDSMSEKMLKAIDCEATIRTVTVRRPREHNILSHYS